MNLREMYQKAREGQGDDSQSSLGKIPAPSVPRTRKPDLLRLRDLYQDYRDEYTQEASIAFGAMSPEDRDDFKYYLQRGNGCGHDDPRDECFAELFAAAIAPATSNAQTDKTMALASHMPECYYLVRQLVKALG